MNPDLLAAYLVVVGVFFATPPGPSQLLMISNSLSHGVRRSLATAAGDLSANVLQMTAAAFGLAAVIGQSAAALSVVKWAGVAYLAWLGIAMFRAKPGSPRRAGGTASTARLYRQGFLGSATNPEAVVFFAALFPQFIDPGLPVWPQLIVLGAIYLTVDGVLLVVFGWLATRSAARLRGSGGRLLNRVSGAMMIVAAALLAGKDLGDQRAPSR